MQTARGQVLRLASSYLQYSASPHASGQALRIAEGQGAAVSNRRSIGIHVRRPTYHPIRSLSNLADSAQAGRREF